MQKRKLKFVVACLTLLSISVQAQSVQDILLKARQAWTTHEHLSMDVEVRLFETETAPGNLMGTALLRKNKDKYYSKFLSTELISTSSGTVILDHNVREISYLPEDGKRKRKDQFIPQIDTSISINDSIVYRGVNGGVHQLEIFHRSGYIVRTVYTLSTTSFLPEKITYFYAAANEEDDLGAFKSELTYTHISFEPIQTDLFSEKKYIVRTGDVVKPAPAYATYHIIAAQPRKQ